MSNRPPRPPHRTGMVWTAVPGGVRGRERLTPVADYLAVLLILIVLFGGSVWFAVWLLRQEEGVAAAVSCFMVLGFGVGLVAYVRGPSKQAVVLRPHEIELPVGRAEVVRVVVRWEDVARVRVLEGETRPTLRVELRDGSRARHADGEDLLQGRPEHGPDPDTVDVTDAEAVARVLRHLLDHPEDRARLAQRGGVGIVLAFARPVYGDAPA
ncbi:glycosyltransferase [Cellulosimicrobium cellulans]|uniref:glycosyltransferase n=1 Tax=Cellulosimicrobium cellulans TaxID=1710 RepID=UPI0028A96DFE|nr:glycosyltransferase [Cellulosimicrobium cellulans]